MKAIMRLFFLVLLISCNETSKQKKPLTLLDEKLQIVLKTTSRHTYTAAGVLDTSYQTDSFYFKGNYVEATNLIITRDYDRRNNLLREKTFQLLKTNELIEEKIFSYDIRNNLISQIDKVDGVTRSIKKRYYNEYNQEIKKVDIQMDLTDLLATNNKRSNPSYDTIIWVYSYDIQGNLIKQTGTNSVTTFTSFSNGQKTFNYGLDENGDTLTTSNYKKVGNLIEETILDKSDSNSYIKTWYDGKKIMRRFFYDGKTGKKSMDTYKYDDKGNEIEHVSYEQVH